MPAYSYKARDAQGKMVKGILNAEDELDLANRLKKMGFYLTQSKISTSKERTIGSAKKRIAYLNSSELRTFTTQLAISLEAGVTLLSSLKDLADGAPIKKVKAVIQDISQHVESGSSLKDALLEHPHSFPKLYTAIIAAGESTGKLHFVLNDLASLLEWQADLKARVSEASIYPIVLAIAMIGVVVVLMVVVVPKFKPMFETLGTNLPLPTLIVVGVSTIIQRLWWLILLGIIGAVTALKVIRSNEQGRRKMDMYILRLPILGDLLMKVSLSRFCHVFALSLRSGVNVFSALGIASEVVGNSYLESAIIKARDYVNVGEKISSALQMSGKFPHLVIRMINVGEQTGSLSETLDKVNEYYDKEVPSTLKKLFAMMEPAMIMGMGLVVGGIAGAVFMPLVKVMGSIGG